MQRVEGPRRWRADGGTEAIGRDSSKADNNKTKSSGSYLSW